MARNYMLMSRVIRDKVQTLAMAETMKMDPDTVVGKLHAVWAWADQQADDCQLVDGVLKPGSAAMVDAKANRKGFAQAMAGVGWLEIGEGFIKFPNADSWLGREAKKRAAHAAKMKRWRDGNVTQNESHEASRNRHATVTREEKRREEKSINTKPPVSPKGDSAVVIPPELDTPDFRKAWGDWLTYQGQRPKGKRQTPKGAEQALARWVREGWTPERVIAAIRVSIERNWQAVYEGNDRTGGLPFSPAPAPSMPSPDSIIASLGKGGRA